MSAGPGRAGEARERDAATLSDLELRILTFERDRSARLGGRETAIREEFGLSAARYYQILHALLESPLALRHDPLLVRRLQRLREARRRARARTLGTHTQDDTD